MVQIRKRRGVEIRRWLRRIVRCCASGILLSSAIPSVFLFRTWLMQQPLPLPQSSFEGVKASSLWLPPALEFLRQIDFATLQQQQQQLHGSDFVELHHCNISSPTIWLDMWNQSETMLLEAVSALRDSLKSEVGEDLSLVAEAAQSMQEEFVLELLEQYAVFHQLCSFRNYRPTVPPSIGKYVAPQLEQRVAATDDDSFRIVFCISAFQDIAHLLRLVRALSNEDGSATILVHLERSTSPQYRRRIETEVPQVIVVQFGTIVYRTDSLSLVNLRILRWLSFDLQLNYDYVVFLDGASFPLLGPSEWKKHIVRQKVWLGELTHNGDKVLQNGLENRLLHQRLISTPFKLNKRLGHHTWNKEDIENNKIQQNLLYKSTSGNQGAYHRDVVRLLLESNDVMELFALSKYGCCCCLEENNWISALGIVGYAEEALQHTSTFQLWGGKSECEGSMNNAVLSLNSSFCYRSEDPASESLYVLGDSILQELRTARERGFLMARKFRSNNQDSDEIINFIERELWEQAM